MPVISFGSFTRCITLLDAKSTMAICFAVCSATYNFVPSGEGTRSVGERYIGLAAVEIDDYAGFMLPCLGAPSYPAPPYVAPEAEALVKDAVNAGKSVAAQVGSVWTLAKAGVLKGKKYAYTLNDRHSYFQEGIWSGDGVVRDGLVMTSGICPYVELKMGGKEHSEELALILAEAMKEAIATDVISVKVPILNPSSELRVQLFTLAGKAIYHDIAKTKVGIRQIPTAGLPNGLYILKITDGKDINLTSKHILMK